MKLFNNYIINYFAIKDFYIPMSFWINGIISFSIAILTVFIAMLIYYFVKGIKKCTQTKSFYCTEIIYPIKQAFLNMEDAFINYNK